MPPPGDRWTADHYLTSWPRQLFPIHFSDVLHPFFGSLLPLDPDARLAAVAANYGQLTAAVQQGITTAEQLGSSSSGMLAVQHQQQQQHPAAVRVRCVYRLLHDDKAEHFGWVTVLLLLGNLLVFWERKARVSFAMQCMSCERTWPCGPSIAADSDVRQAANFNC